MSGCPTLPHKTPTARYGNKTKNKTTKNRRVDPLPPPSGSNAWTFKIERAQDRLNQSGNIGHRCDKIHPFVVQAVW